MGAFCAHKVDTIGDNGDASVDYLVSITSMRPRSIRAKPARKDLLAVINTLQGVIGSISAAANDRNPNRAAHIEVLTRFGVELCIAARARDVPTAGSNSVWATITPPDLSKIA